MKTSKGSPSRLGLRMQQDDIPLFLQDRSINQDSSFRYASSMYDRMIGMIEQFVVEA